MKRESEAQMVNVIEGWWCCGIPRDVALKLVQCPHLVILDKGRALAEIGEVTHCKPAPWRLIPVYDDEGRFIWDDKPPFQAWGNPYNQQAIFSDQYQKRGRPFYQDIYVIIDCSLDEAVLDVLFPTSPHGDYVHDLKSAIANIATIKWAAFPDCGDSEKLFFFCSPDREAWITELKDRLGPLGLLPK